MHISDSRHTEVLVKHPTIVIGVPAYNEEAFIESTLDSLRQQTWTDFAVLIGDNGSTDSTAEICRRVCREDSRFTVFTQPKNIGAAGNFNFLRDATESPLFMWLGGHDKITPGFLEKHIAAMNRDPALSLSYSVARIVEADGNVLGEILDDSPCRLPKHPVLRYILNVEVMVYCTPIMNVIRREAMKRTEFTVVSSCDRVMLSHIAFFGPFHCVSDEFYIATIPRKVDSPEQQAMRLSGVSPKPLDRRELMTLFLDDFDSLTRNYTLRPLYRWMLRSVVGFRLVPEAGTAGSALLRMVSGLKKITIGTTYKLRRA